MTAGRVGELERLARLVDRHGWSDDAGRRLSVLFSPSGKAFVFGKTSWDVVSAAFVAAYRAAHPDYPIANDCRCLACRRRRATIVTREAWRRWKRASDHRDVRKTLLAASGSGGCRVCGKRVERGRGNRWRSWHDGRNGEPNCLETFFVATTPAHDRRAWPFWMRRCGGRCEQCGGAGPFQVDHVVPLVDGGSPWPENLQLLCEICHGRKTAAENSERMRARQRLVDDERRARRERRQIAMFA